MRTLLLSWFESFYLMIILIIFIANGMKNRAIKNWKTFLMGIVTGIPLIISGITTRNVELIGAGVGAILTGYFAQDAASKIPPPPTL